MLKKIIITGALFCALVILNNANAQEIPYKGIFAKWSAGVSMDFSMQTFHPNPGNSQGLGLGITLQRPMGWCPKARISVNAPLLVETARDREGKVVPGTKYVSTTVGMSYSMLNAFVVRPHRPYDFYLYGDIGLAFPFTELIIDGGLGAQYTFNSRSSITLEFGPESINEEPFAYRYRESGHMSIAIRATYLYNIFRQFEYPHKGRHRW